MEKEMLVVAKLSGS